jgi:hypothetical protein
MQGELQIPVILTDLCRVKDILIKLTSLNRVIEFRSLARRLQAKLQDFQTLIDATTLWDSSLSIPLSVEDPTLLEI